MAKPAARSGNGESSDKSNDLQQILVKLQKLNKLDALETKINKLGTLESTLGAKLSKLESIDSRIANIEENVQDLPKIIKRLGITVGRLTEFEKE